MVTFEDLMSKKEKICVVGLGYVGLPLAVLLAKKFSVIGFDVNGAKIEDLKNGIDKTGEVEKDALEEAHLELTTDPEAICRAKFLILAIPTPVDDNKKPDLTLLERASAMVGENMAAGSVIVYESTVYPGVTEDVCLPILEEASGLKAGRDFKVGYSPERVNPGDREHTIKKIIKVVSGMDAETLDIVDGVYKSVITAGTWRASSIKVAEAAKVIENTQRDLNIALINELAIIFNTIGIDTYEVLAAAGTKWNFLKFFPGLVGGHCIGVDPYYLTYKAESLGYLPEVILAGRRINDSMGKFAAQQIIKRMAKMNKMTASSKVVILGITFKEDVPDIRNSKVIDLYNELCAFGLKPLIYDPLARPEEVKEVYGLDLCAWEDIAGADTLIIAVPHRKFKLMKIADYRALMNADKLLIADFKHVLDRKEVKAAGAEYWSL